MNLPWNCRKIGTAGLHNEFIVCEIVDSKGGTVVGHVCEPQASFIVESVNALSADSLLDDANEILDKWELRGDDSPSPTRDLANRAIRLATTFVKIIK